MLSQLTFIVPSAEKFTVPSEEQPAEQPKYNSSDDFAEYKAVIGFLKENGIKVLDITRMGGDERQRRIKELDEPSRKNEVSVYRETNVRPTNKVLAGCQEIIDKICVLLEPGEFVTGLLEEELDYSASSIEPT